jgi:hypothetical protein
MASTVNKVITWTCAKTSANTGGFVGTAAISGNTARLKRRSISTTQPYSHLNKYPSTDFSYSLPFPPSSPLRQWSGYFVGTGKTYLLPLQSQASFISKLSRLLERSASHIITISTVILGNLRTEAA